jgi:hypothetical protein|tara:strand:- start:97 stop:495 length:399 start_codon:yes stop_codon:yes gene_type:complete
MTVDDLAAMIDEAAWVARNLYGRAWPAGMKGWWPEIVHDRFESYGWNAAQSPRVRPTGAQIDLLDHVTQMLASAPVASRKLLWSVGMIRHRSSGDTNWSAVARENGGVHAATAKRRYIEGLVALLHQYGDDP